MKNNTTDLHIKLSQSLKEFVKDQGSISNYIRELIERDMLRKAGLGAIVARAELKEIKKAHNRGL